MGVVGLHRGLDVGQRERAVGLVRKGLRLHAAEHGGAAGFVAVGVRLLADQVLVAALAVAHDRAQIALRARGHEERGLEAELAGDALLQGVDGGVVAEHVVAERRAQHRVAHGGGGAGDGVAAQIDGCHGVSRKLRSMACPCSERMDSGWNCTPSIRSSAWRTPMISPSSEVAVTHSVGGSARRSIASEW